MELSGNLVNAVIADSIIFILEFLLLLFWFYITPVKGVTRWFFFLYGVITFSSYNLYIKVIQDFNIPIPRTFLNKFKIVGPFYPIDILILVLFIYIVIKAFKSFYLIDLQAKWKLGVSIFLINVFVFFVSSIGYFVYVVSGNPGDFVAQIRPVRGILLGAISIYFFTKILGSCRSQEKANQILKSFIIIDAINIAGEIFASRAFYDYLWERGGHKVILLDQADLYLAILYLPYLASLKKNKLLAIASIILVILMFLNYVKAFILLLPILIISLFITNLLALKVDIKYSVYVLLVMLVGAYYFIDIANDKAITGTRAIQLSSYVADTSSKMTTFFIGIGPGGKYKVTKDTEDAGEIKEIDRNEMDSLQTEFQIPFFIYYKIAGILGLLIIAAPIISFFKKAVFYVRKNQTITAFYITLISFILYGPPFIKASPDEVMYFTRFVFTTSLLTKLFYLSGNSNLTSNDNR